MSYVVGDADHHQCIGHLETLGEHLSSELYYCKKCHRMFYLLGSMISSNTGQFYRNPTVLLSYRYDIMEVDDESAKLLKEKYSREITELEPYKTNW
jgi:hypothetical protein